jgi:serine/threonine-protein kinase
MSPEQASGDTADARSDLYATGLLLFEMIAGEGPFDDLGDTSQQMLAHLHRPARPLSRLTEVPPEIEAIVKRALAKRPQDRPRSAEYMAAELAPFAATSAKKANGVPLTPSGVVLNSSALFAGLGLGSEWEKPTVEISTLHQNKGFLSSFSSPKAHRSIVSGHAVGAAVVAGLTVGIAVLAFGAASNLIRGDRVRFDAIGGPGGVGGRGTGPRAARSRSGEQQHPRRGPHDSFHPG